MVNIKGTKTEKELLKAFAGESQARTRYYLFAQKAREEGYEKIAAIFEETAMNEREHAKRFFSYLEGGMTEITASFPAGKVGTTAENLKAAAEGENEEHTELYPNAAEIAKEEGFTEISTLFTKVAEVEQHHEKRYLELMKKVKNNEIFKKESETEWKCMNCGYIHKGKKPPAKCPTCRYPKSYFEVLCEKF
ncbi:MAG: rubrerythrin family protein [Candidatus Mcinerneyibacterium aminivorans]|uniref:Rubrerythrin family protein n=1 Tax=Candidatus Mcinerneyibacterium aminivorans TaxID=2703815 RepID=A0A5D0MHI4_9BACT|nr:MAG: rubrerythrin family protein [Candidatus Mcinerneyibacterium aminivorans]